MEVTLPQAVIRTPDEFTPKYRRLIRTLIEIAVKNGVFHKRKQGWLDEMIERNYARGFINNNRVTGFCVMRQVDGIDNGPVYAEACLWKNQYRNQTQNMLLVEAKRIGGSMYGAFYSTNSVAKDFYALEHGYEYVTHEQLPLPILYELQEHLNEIVIIFHPLDKN